MKEKINLSIAGIGVIIYSPFAARHITEGEDFLSSHFWEPEMVAKYVSSCQIAAFCTGSPVNYAIKLIDGVYPAADINNAKAKIRLGIEVRDQTLCVRDLYDLMEWKTECPAKQAISIQDGFYLLTVYTQLPLSGVIGDNQTITVHFQPELNQPVLNWSGVPDLSCD